MYAFNRAAVGRNRHRLVDFQRGRAKRHAVHRRHGDGCAHRQTVVLDGKGQGRSLPRQVNDRAFRREILARHGQLVVQRHACGSIHIAEFHLHASIRGDDRQRAFPAEHRQRVIAYARVNRHHAACRRGFNGRHLRADARIQNGIVQLPEVKFQIGDLVIQISVGHHGENVARFHFVTDAHAQIGQRAVRAREHICLIARGGRARAVNGFLHRAAGHNRTGIALVAAAFRLFLNIGLEAKQPRAGDNSQHDDGFHRFADDSARFTALFLFRSARGLRHVLLRFMRILFTHEIHPPDS